MAILGAQMSIAGGYHKAVEKAHLCGCDCLQLFTKSNSQWWAKPITSEEARRFRSALVPQITNVYSPRAVFAKLSVFLIHFHILMVWLFRVLNNYGPSGRPV